MSERKQRNQIVEVVFAGALAQNTIPTALPIRFVSEVIYVTWFCFCQPALVAYLKITFGRFFNNHKDHGKNLDQCMVQCEDIIKTKNEKISVVKIRPTPPKSPQKNI
uniref:Uncharacterized protein n=1 Tax=Lepeophtheirus salmonis TaxID=72036 RepID=A0A0K2V815_LEPSM